MHIDPGPVHTIEHMTQKEGEFAPAVLEHTRNINSVKHALLCIMYVSNCACLQSAVGMTIAMCIEQAAIHQTYKVLKVGAPCNAALNTMIHTHGGSMWEAMCRHFLPSAVINSTPLIDTTLVRMYL